MLLTKNVEVKLRKSNIEYFLSKGYSGQLCDIICVKTEDLQPYSEIKIQYQCDYPNCNEIHTIRYSDYLKKRTREYAQEGDFCNTHSKIIKKEWKKKHNLQEYWEDYKQRLSKTKATNIRRYGVENPMQNESVKQHLKAVMLEKYGYENSMQVPEIKEKFFLNAEEKEGNKFNTLTSKNGKAFYMINGVPCSTNQKHLWELFGGEINIYKFGYFLDILFDNNIYFEYNGTGHELSVKIGHMNEQEFLLKEIKRYKVLRQKGYKQMLFVSTKNRDLPSDNILLSLQKYAFNYLKNNNWIEFNYDNNYIRTKYWCISYDFQEEL